MKEGAKGPFVRSRLVAMEAAHGVRFDSFAGTAPLKCIKIIISRAASIKNTRVGHLRVLALNDISVAYCCQRKSRLRCIRRVEKKKRDTCGK